MADGQGVRVRATGPRPSRALHLALFGAAALIAATAGASAQMLPFPPPFFDDGAEPLIPPRAIVYRLRDQGFSEIGRPRFDGAAYVIDATSPAGARLRLFVDARDGDLIGRRRLDTLIEPGRGVARAAPGYGWTADEPAPRRGDPRDGEALIPPGEIPMAPRQRPFRTEANLAPAAPMRSGPDTNALGVNPDSASPARTAPTASRKTPRPAAPKAQAVRTAPDAPLPPIDSVPRDAARGAAAASPKSAAVPDNPERGSAAPAVNPSRPPEVAGQAASQSASPEAPREHNPAAATSEQKTWATPEPKRNVRVIGGATIVPGAGPSAESGAN